MRKTISRTRRAVSVLTIASALVLSACTPATSRLGIPAEAGNAEVDSATSFHVIPVRGALVAADGHIDARLEPFASAFSAAHSSVELYVSGFPTEEFDAEVIDVVPLGEGWYRAIARLRLTDARLQRSAAVEGRLYVASNKNESTSPKSRP
jgi:hypothetical protein